MSRLRIGEQEYTGSVKSNSTGFDVTLNGEVIRLERVETEIYRTVFQGRQILVAATRLKDRTVVEIDAHLIEVFEAGTSGRGNHEQHGAKDKVSAPMPGKVVKVLVAVGEMVKARQQLVLVEAMKMENPVVAPAAGMVKAIHVVAGEQVNTEKILVELDLSATC